MKKTAKKAYHFLGGACFAIILIALTTLLVIAGTFIESRSGSHLNAAALIYDSTFFSLLLWGFFINILFAALRRWPFQKKHIPFLITHWGLLMILGGVLIKHYTGVQGTMFLMEGGATDQLMLPHSHALRVDVKSNTSPIYLKLPIEHLNKDISTIDVTGHHMFPHCSELFDTFIKGPWVVLEGKPPLPLGHPFKTSISGMEWIVLGLKDIDPQQELYAYYTQNSALVFSNPLTGERLLEIPLEKALKIPFFIQGKPVDAALDIPATFNESMIEASLTVAADSTEIRVPLQGNNALANIPTKPEAGSTPFSVDIVSTPSLLFLQGCDENLLVVAIGPYGDIDIKRFSQDTLGPLYSYDQGFGGYSMQATLSIADNNRLAMEQQQNQHLVESLTNTPFKKEDLSPPLQLLWNACKQTNSNFPIVLIGFLDHWHRTGAWLCPSQHPLPETLKLPFAAMDWSWLPESNWSGHALKNLSAEDNAYLLSSYCRVYNIHLSSIRPEGWSGSSRKEVILESPLTTRHKLLPPGNKPEENTPLLLLKMKGAEGEQQIALSYDNQAQRLKWPAKNGELLLRYQPQFISIPYEVRLRRAQQVSYPNSNQPYSFISDLAITDKRSGKSTETSISMNNVYETSDGYRLYLASMFPADETDVKRIQLVVNRDPAKYILTYPGSFILSIGIILLFWLRPYSKK